MPRPTATASAHSATPHSPVSSHAPVAPAARADATPGFTVNLCVPDDQLMHLPKRVKPGPWPAHAPLPRTGDVLYLTSTSAWVVVMVIHERIPAAGIRIEVWVEHCGSARMQRPDDDSWFH